MEVGYCRAVPLTISSLTLYPVKSCAAVPVRHLRFGHAGPEWDREWMIIGGDGKFVTQRELAALAHVKPFLDFEAGVLRLTFGGQRHGVEVPLVSASKPIEAEIWGDVVPALDEGVEAANWLSAALGVPLRLARITAAQRHRTGADPRAVRFVDSYPLHVACLSSLDDLNRRLPSPIGIDRFRANVVLAGGAPWSEDNWTALRIDGSTFRLGKRCERCVITTVDPHTALKGPEPLKTLAGFRRNAKNKIEFGQYLHTSVGAELTVGMDVEAL
jgi:uncharacterized protein YcbX